MAALLAAGWIAACAWGTGERPAGAAPAAGDARSVSGEPRDSLERDVRLVLERQAAAWNRGDLEAFMAGYWNSPELVFTSGGRVYRGFDTLRERYRSTYGQGAELGRLEFDSLEVHPLAPDAAWALGRWRLERASSDTLGGVFSLVFRKLDGAWKIVHDHTSSNAAPRREPGEPSTEKRP